MSLFSEAEIELQPCTADGQHNVTSLELRKQTDPCATAAGFHEMSIKCGDDDDALEKLEFIRSCDGEVRNSGKSSFAFGSLHVHNDDVTNVRRI